MSEKCKNIKRRISSVVLVTGGGTPTTQTTKKGENVRYFNYDHLGNTRVSYSLVGDANKPTTYQISGIYDYHPPLVGV